MKKNKEYKMDKQIEEVNKIFLDYFREKKGVYSQSDVEKIVKQTQKDTLDKVRQLIESTMDKEKAKEICDNLELVYGERFCKICGCNPEHQRQYLLDKLNQLENEQY